MSGSLIGLRSCWRRAREQLGGVVPILKGKVSDITERKRAEEERQALSRDLKESNARLEEAQRVAHVGYWEWDLATGEVIWSDETYRIFGLTPQERPMNFAMVRGMVHPEDREALYSGVDAELGAGTHPVAEFRIVTPGGEVRTVHAITSKLWSAMPGDPDSEGSGKARKLFGTVQDVTELKRLLKEEILAILDTAYKQPVQRVDGGPEVILVVGVNGTGKTTTIGKLAQFLRSDGKTVLLCAADTFRAAAIDQLEVWGQRTGTEIGRAHV